jgi:hypothetical protein
MLESKDGGCCDCRKQGRASHNHELNSHLCILLSFVVLVSGDKPGGKLAFVALNLDFLTVSVFLLVSDVPLRVLEELVNVFAENLFKVLHARLGSLAPLLGHSAAVWVRPIFLVVFVDNGIVLDGITHQTLVLS